MKSREHNAAPAECKSPYILLAMERMKDQGFKVIGSKKVFPNSGFVLRTNHSHFLRKDKT